MIGGTSIRFLEGIDCDRDKRASKWYEDHSSGQQDWEIAQKSRCRLAARGLPPGAFAVVLFLCGCTRQWRCGGFWGPDWQV